MLKTTLSVIIFTGIALALISGPALAVDGVPMMSKEALKEMLANDDLIILDLRTQPDWTASEYKIKNALRVDPHDFQSWGALFPKNKLLVLY